MLRRFNNRLNSSCCVCKDKQVEGNSTCTPTTRPEAVISKRITGITLIDGKVAILFDDNTHITANMSILSDSLVSHILHGNSGLNLDSLNTRVTALETKPEVDVSLLTTKLELEEVLKDYVNNNQLVLVRNLENTQDLFKAIKVESTGA